jgi:small subunit ribosomal protein S1
MDEQNTQPAGPTGETTEPMTEAQAPVAMGESNGATPAALGSSSAPATDNGQDLLPRAEEPAATPEPDIVATAQEPAVQEPAAQEPAAQEPAAAQQPDAPTMAEPAAGGDTDIVTAAQEPAASPAQEAPAPEETAPAPPTHAPTPPVAHDPHAPRREAGDTGKGGENDMAALLAESDTQFRQLKYGDVIEGTVMRKDADEVLVDIGFKSEGIIPSNELSSLTATELANLSIGDEVLVSVLQPEDKEGHVVLSLDRARQEKSWRKLQKQYENNEIIEAEVNGYNKGGLLVNLEGVRGFVPASQVTGLSSGGTDAAKQSELSRFTGQRMPLKIIEINRNRNRLILSERQAAQEQRDARKEQLLAELTPGQIREGHVSSICDFGAFVDIGGADGLIHLSELSWSRVNHPSEVLKVGQPVRVYVMSVDERDRKIALSLKRTQPEPWSQVMEHYQLGQLVRGTITQLTDFGAFARLEDGIEGLIHVSELAEGRVTHPRNVVQEGWELTLRVIRIDPQRRRMGLSLKRAMEPQEGDTMEPQGALPVPTPRVAGEGDAQGARGARGGQGGRGGGRGRGRDDEQSGGEEAVAQAGATPGGEPAEQPVTSGRPAPAPAPQPAPPPPRPVFVDEGPQTAMAQAWQAARAEQSAQAEQASGAEPIAEPEPKPASEPVAQAAPPAVEEPVEEAPAPAIIGGDDAPQGGEAAGEPVAAQSPAFTDMAPPIMTDTQPEQSDAGAGGSAAGATEAAQDSEVAGQTSAAASDVNSDEAPGAEAEDTTE